MVKFIKEEFKRVLSLPPDRLPLQRVAKELNRGQNMQDSVKYKHTILRVSKLTAKY